MAVESWSADQNFENFEGFYFELELPEKNKWLFSYSYNHIKVTQNNTTQKTTQRKTTPI